MPNTFRDSLALGVVVPKRGESFDRNNDLFLDCDGIIRPRHEWQGPEIDTTKHSSVLAACHDAIINYNRATMKPSEFAYFYGDDPTE